MPKIDFYQRFSARFESNNDSPTHKEGDQGSIGSDSSMEKSKKDIDNFEFFAKKMMYFKEAQKNSLDPLTIRRNLRSLSLRVNFSKLNYKNSFF